MQSVVRGADLTFPRLSVRPSPASNRDGCISSTPHVPQVCTVANGDHFVFAIHNDPRMADADSAVRPAKRGESGVRGLKRSVAVHLNFYGSDDVSVVLNGDDQASCPDQARSGCDAGVVATTIFTCDRDDAAADGCTDPEAGVNFEMRVAWDHPQVRARLYETLNSMHILVQIVN